MIRRPWIPAIALVIAANGLLLLLGAVNRAGRPDASVRLTERELSLGRPGEGASVTELDLVWEQRGDWLRDSAGWFDREKLAALGFDCEMPPTAPAAPSRYGKALPRKAY